MKPRERWQRGHNHKIEDLEALRKFAVDNMVKEPNKAKRQNHIKILSQKDPQKLVYLDESGIDDSEEYTYAWGPKGQRLYA